jgi:spore coat polysaccharide biosynthesis predicted glycosyltransferase SpsG
VKVVIGWHSSEGDAIKRVAEGAPFIVELCQGVEEMALLMAASDLAIGAAGSSSWERCCLGLPTVMMVLADNQRAVGMGLAAAGAVSIVELEDVDAGLPAAVAALTRDNSARRAMGKRAAAIVDGLGVSRVIDAMEALHA